uniref:Uncharacterized protein n=1 Tax=Prolemur simus TaxID=1328070 RepID=A0A8C9AXZ6_PROSS
MICPHCLPDLFSHLSPPFPPLCAHLGSHPSQGLCTCCSLCQENSFPRHPHGSFSPPSGLLVPTHVALLPVFADSFKSVPLLTFPETIQGIIQSDLNYSVILEWVTTMNPEAVLSWTLNGKICGTGEKLFIPRLSREPLGTYVRTATSSEEQLSSQPVTVMLPPIVDPTDVVEPIEPDPTLSLSGGPAIALLVAGILGGLVLMGAVGSLRVDRSRSGVRD